MDAIRIFEVVIVMEALGLMMFVLIKLWYHDIFLKKTTLTRNLEKYVKYGLFKKGLLFTFIYISSLFLQKLISIGHSSAEMTYLFSIAGNLSLVCLSYTLFKISSHTYGRWKAK